MRPQILFPLFAPISTLKGVGSRVAPLLEKLAGPIVRDVLFLKPHTVVRRTPAEIDQGVDGEIMTFHVHVESHIRPRGPQQPWRIRVFDNTGFLTLVFFGNYGASLEDRHPVNAARIVSGKIEQDRSEWRMVHPDYFVDAAKAADVPQMEAVYPATAGLPARTVRKFAAESLSRAPDPSEWLDRPWVAQERFPTWREALTALHNPQSEADLSNQSPHWRRLAYDELLAHQLALAERKAARQAQAAAAIQPSAEADRLQADLPFAFTGAQTRALAEIRGDLGSGQRMSRLIQGDVGSGKTVVAMCAMADVAAGGGQSVLMAPTEILARQHFETIAGPLSAHGVAAVLLTGRDKGAARAEKLRALASGAARVAVGTHALFQDDVAFQALQLAIIDEQHRFGVSERQRLQSKGASTHLLAMSATPIPRTLELTVYGDLDVSRIDEKPPGRTPVATRAMPMTRVAEVEDRLRAALTAGAQAFWICPMVAESELIDLKAAETRAVELAASLGPALAGRVGLIHGKMTAQAKDAVMADFAENRLSILVATTVVEVGVNVPNATIMVIEQAERFGLAQLHQLRGRVGRGARESACVLLYDPPLSEIAQRRLDILRRTDDGFVIAETDLELRGGGDALGLRQSGFPDYIFADPIAHRDLIAAAGDDARLIVSQGLAQDGPRAAGLEVLEALFDWKVGLGLRAAG